MWLETRNEPEWRGTKLCARSTDPFRASLGHPALASDAFDGEDLCSLECNTGLPPSTCLSMVAICKIKNKENFFFKINKKKGLGTK